MVLDPTKRILDNRDLLREKNLQSEIKIWKKIIELNDKDIDTKKSIKVKLNNIELNDINKNEFKRVFETIAKSIYRMNKIHYGLSGIKDVSLENIKSHISKILNMEKEQQIFFCTEPNKQGVDEDEQLIMLNEELNIFQYKALGDQGDIFISEKGISSTKKGYSKRIDAIIIHEEDLNKTFDEIEDPIFIGYNKFIKDAGGHQNNQLDDACNFVVDSNRYCEKFDNKKFFYVQLDGPEAEKKMDLVKNRIESERICVGNTIKIIEWSKKIILNNE